jgi:hypothetical protein
VVQTENLSVYQVDFSLKSSSVILKLFMAPDLQKMHSFYEGNFFVECKIFFSICCDNELLELGMQNLVQR